MTRYPSPHDSETRPQFSRAFQSFKFWVSLPVHGRSAYARRVSHDAQLARYLAARIKERPEFELVTPVTLSICSFRYTPPDLPTASAVGPYLNEINERIMTEIQLDGRTYLPNAVLSGRFTPRASIVNLRTETEDLGVTPDVAAEIGPRLDKELRPQNLQAAWS